MKKLDLAFILKNGGGMIVLLQMLLFVGFLIEPAGLRAQVPTLNCVDISLNATDLSIPRNYSALGCTVPCYNASCNRLQFEVINEGNTAIPYPSGFVDSMSTTTAADLVHLDNEEKEKFESVKQVLSFSAEQAGQMAVLANQLNILTAQVHNDLDSLAMAMFVIQVQMDSIFGQLISNRQQVKDTATIASSVLKVQNNSIGINTIQEENEKVVKDIKLTTIAIGIDGFNIEQKQQLLYVASQCPLAGGEVVYEARTYYAEIADTLFDDYSSCQQAGLQYRHFEEESSHDRRFKIYPNPASSLLTIEVQNCGCCPQIEIVTTMGQAIKRVNLNERKTVIDVHELANGFYILNLLVDGIVIDHKPLVKL